jgi:RNase P/RNase MRP subunit p29
MRRISVIVVGVVLVALVVGVVFAAAPKTYQVTGPVVSVTNDVIVVQKGDDKWEVGRDAATKITGDLKVGAKVTIYYKMVATSVDVKSEKAK